MVVPVEPPSDSDTKLYLQLRNTFLENLNSNGNYDDYEEADIERIRTDDKYCQRFINHKKGNLENALEMVDESLRWRKSFGCKDCTMASIPLDFFKVKAVFPYNKDKEGNPIIMILVRYHKKAPEFVNELRRFVIYWVEMMEEQTQGGHMSVIMSCEGAGLSNLDLDLIKFLITLFHAYYPDSLEHILIYEMPWILNPAWKIIKAWLPADFVDKIKFVSKSTVQNYVTAENLPVDMGGTCTAEYEPPTEEDMVNAKNAAETKKVRFSHAPKSLKDIKGVKTDNGVSKPSQVVITDDYTVIGGILKITPATQLLFAPVAENTAGVVIQLSSVAEKTISYKVKTNNIESYRVKPSLGFIEPGSSIEINVVLLPGHEPLPSDKFLIMAMEITDSSLSIPALNALWKSTSSDLIADHKLKCILQKDDKAAREESLIVGKLDSITAMLENLQSKLDSMEARQASLHTRQTITLCLVFLLFFAFLGHVCTNSEFVLPHFLDKLF